MHPLHSAARSLLPAPMACCHHDLCEQRLRRELPAGRCNLCCHTLLHNSGLFSQLCPRCQHKPHHPTGPQQQKTCSASTSSTGTKPSPAVEGNDVTWHWRPRREHNCTATSPKAQVGRWRAEHYIALSDLAVPHAVILKVPPLQMQTLPLTATTHLSEKTATIRAVYPLSSVASGSAPHSTSAFTAAVWPLFAACIRGRPRRMLSVSSMSASHSASSRITSGCPTCRQPRWHKVVY